MRLWAIRDGGIITGITKMKSSCQPTEDADVVKEPSKNADLASVLEDRTCNIGKTFPNSALVLSNTWIIDYSAQDSKRR